MSNSLNPFHCSSILPSPSPPIQFQSHHINSSSLLLALFSLFIQMRFSLFLLEPALLLFLNKATHNPLFDGSQIHKMDNVDKKRGKRREEGMAKGDQLILTDFCGGFNFDGFCLWLYFDRIWGWWLLTNWIWGHF